MHYVIMQQVLTHLRGSGIAFAASMDSQIVNTLC